MSTRRIVLVGLPGAGKSTVGRALAERLGWSFVDVDDEIVAATGQTVAELFTDRGEAEFRVLESQLTTELSSRDRVVLAPGGGWAAQPGSLESLPAGTVVVWLEVSPVEALQRLRGSTVQRPLLSGPDPLAALARLAEQRSDRYRQAQLSVSADGRSAADIALEIHTWLERSTS